MGLLGALLSVGVNRSPASASAPRTPAKTKYAYVTTREIGTIWVVDTASNTVASTIALPQGDSFGGIYESVASPDGSRLYVTQSQAEGPDGKVFVIDTAAAKIVDTITVPSGPVGIAVNPSGTRLYVTAEWTNQVAVIDTTSDTVVATVDVGPGPTDVALSPDGRRAYVANNGNTDPLGTISVIDTTNNTVVATVSVDSGPIVVSVSPNGKRVYVAGLYYGSGDVGGRVQTIDAATNTVIASVVMDGTPEGLAISPDGHRLYVSVHHTGDNPGVLRTVDTATNTIITGDDTVVGIDPVQVTLNASGTRAYVPNEYVPGSPYSSVSVIDTTAHTPGGLAVLATVAVGRLPYSVTMVTCATKVCNTGPGPQELRDPADPPTPTPNRFGSSMDISGDTAVVGAPGGDTYGAADVYVRSNGQWVQQATLAASDAEVFDRFGSSVAISGDTVVVGASYDTTDAGLGAGSVYVFVRTGTTWTEQAHLTATDGGENDGFGTSVDIDTDRIAVGAPGHDSQTGSVYVFERASGVWPQRAEPQDVARAPLDQLGTSVAVSGGTVAAGASGHRFVDVFVNAGGTWARQAKLTHAGPNAQNFGYAVDIDANKLVVGAPAGKDASGAAYVFTRSAGQWSIQAELDASDTHCGTICGKGLGFSVAILNQTVVAGAPFEDIDYTGDSAGAAYVFQQEPNTTTWAEKNRLHGLGPAQYDEFGTSVALSRTTTAVGAPRPDGTSTIGVGSAWMFPRL